MLSLNNKKIIIIILIVIIIGFIFYKETKVIGIIWGAEHDFTEIEGVEGEPYVYTKDEK